jgi:mono/diheme cytochrome c family protein
MTTHFFGLAAIVGLSLLGVSSAGAQSAPAATAKNEVTFAKDIQPLFQKSCVECHGPNKSKGKIRLDTLELALKGGSKGKILEPGDLTKGPLVRSIARQGKEPMPPKDKKPLTAEEVALIRAWVEQGAK